MKDKTDEGFLKRLRDEIPEVLEAEVDFDEKIIRALPSKRTKEIKLKVSLRPPKKRRKKS